MTGPFRESASVVKGTSADVKITSKFPGRGSWIGKPPLYQLSHRLLPNNHFTERILYFEMIGKFKFVVYK